MKRLGQLFPGLARLLRVHALLLVFGLLASAQAAENPPPANEEEASAETEELESQAPAEDTQNPTEEEEESPGRFIPTEEISQDLGVSFPVDI